MAKGRISRGQLAAFALPSIPISALGLPIVVYLPPFYAEDMGLSLSLVGWIFMIARFWDVFTDPVLGTVSDRIHSPWGRRRHWIVLSVPMLMFCAYMVFVPTAPVSSGRRSFRTTITSVRASRASARRSSFSACRWCCSFRR